MTMNHGFVPMIRDQDRYEKLGIACLRLDGYERLVTVGLWDLDGYERPETAGLRCVFVRVAKWGHCELQMFVPIRCYLEARIQLVRIHGSTRSPPQET